MDPTLAARQTRKIQTYIMAARSIIERWGSHERPTHLTEADLRAVLTETRGLVKLLGEADRIERAALYWALGLSIDMKKKLQPGRHSSAPSWSYVVAGVHDNRAPSGLQTRHYCWSRGLHYAAAQALHYSMSLRPR